MMSKVNKQRLITRLKSLAWRTGMMVLVVAVNFAMENLGSFGLPTEVSVIVGLVLGEVSKELNNRYDFEKYLRRTKS